MTDTDITEKLKERESELARIKDNVNHPAHYETGKFECIEVMEEIFGKEAVMHFCQCNAFKYLYRMNRKNGTEDIEKAQWYMNRYLKLNNELKNS